MDDDFDLEIPAEKDLNYIFFENLDFFKYHPRLTDQNVMLYFATSPFWEASNNLNALMNTQMITEPSAVKDFLARSRGYFYEAEPATPIDPMQPMQPIWLIKKKYSFGMEAHGEMREIGLYYIWDNKVFQAPTWLNLGSCRLWQACSSTQSALEQMWKHKETLLNEVKNEHPPLAQRKDPASQLLMENALATLEQQFPVLKRKRDESLRALVQPVAIPTPNPSVNQKEL